MTHGKDTRPQAKDQPRVCVCVFILMCMYTDENPDPERGAGMDFYVNNWERGYDMMVNV